MDFELLDIAKLSAAVAAGAVIGFERELADKPAGFRTNIMICLGAALFTLLSGRMPQGLGAGDPTRIAAQIVTGVGFLGAGAIIQSRGSVIGLTTAATIWAVASVGMAFGGGHFILGLLGTCLATLVLIGLGFAEQAIGRWRRIVHYHVQLATNANAAEVVDRIRRESGVLVTRWSLEKSPEGLSATLIVLGPPGKLWHFEHGLVEEEAVLTLERL